MNEGHRGVKNWESMMLAEAEGAEGVPSGFLRKCLPFLLSRSNAKCDLSVVR